MKRNIVKLISVLMLIVCAFTLCSCGKKENTDAAKEKTEEELLQETAEKNSKAILGNWVVENVKKIETGNMNDLGATMTTNLLFAKDTEIRFLSDGSFTSGIYNLKYKMVDNQFIYTYENQTFAYDCELTEDTLKLSTPNVIEVTLIKK